MGTIGTLGTNGHPMSIVRRSMIRHLSRGQSMDTFQRAKNICLTPATEWPVIAAEPATPGARQRVRAVARHRCARTDVWRPEEQHAGTEARRLLVHARMDCRGTADLDG